MSCQQISGSFQRGIGPLNTWFDWTGGCVALADDQALARVATLARRGGATVSIR